MKYSHRLSDAVHILVYLEILGSNSGSAIAASVNSNPSLIRRLVAHMVKAGILDRSGQRGEIKIKLTRPAGQVSLLDIYQAVESHQEFLDVDQEINQLQPISRCMPEVLGAAYQQVQKAAEQEMARISLQSVVDQVRAKINGEK